MARRIGRGLAWGLAWLIIALAFAITILPPFLDRIYYDGPVSGHYDGERFFNPDGEDTVRVPSGGSRAGFIWSRLTGAGQPEWPERVAVRPSPPAERPLLKDGEMRVTWVGHATALIETPGFNILTDPIWSDVAGPFGIGPSRVAEPGVRFDDLPPIDLVVVSHNHYDHMDLATLKRLWERDGPAVVTSLGNELLMNDAVPSHDVSTENKAWKIRALTSCFDACAPMGAIALDWEQVFVTLEAPGNNGYDYHGPWNHVSVSVTRNHHWSSRWGVDRNRALWSSFIISTPSGAVFFAGDTGLGDGEWPAEAMKMLAMVSEREGRQPAIRLALIPIGAFRFRPGQLGTGSHIGPPDALKVWNRLGRPWTLPIHWGTFRLSSEAYDTPPRMLAELMRCSGGPSDAFAAREIGRPWMVPPVRSGPPLDEARIEPCTKMEAVRSLK